MATESVSKLLDENADLRPLTARLELIKRLQRRYRTLAPEQLAEASRVCAIDGTTVVICATSGPVAAVLRQIAPRLLEGLRGQARKSPKSSADQELTSIRVEVQVKENKPKRAVAPRTGMSSEALSRVADKLADSPLKETLLRMSRPDQRKRTR
jgi:hypothetical protein